MEATPPLIPGSSMFSSSTIEKLQITEEFLTNNIKLSGNISGEITLEAPPTTNNYTLTFPPNTGTLGQVLTTNGSGITSWSNGSSGSGDVISSGTSNNNSIVRFSGTTGKLIQNSDITISDTNNLSGINDISALGISTIGNSIFGGTNLGFFGKSNSQQFTNGSLNSIITILKSYGLVQGFTQQGFKLIDNFGSGDQGTSVAISGDGTTIASGNIFEVGSVSIFTFSDGLWIQQGLSLVGSDNIGFSKQGSSVSLSQDGNTLAIGGPQDNGDAGATWIFTRSSDSWTQQGSKIIGIGGLDTPRQGCSVSLSADGNTLAIGGRGDNLGLGATWIFTRSAGVWSQEDSKLVGTGASGNSSQGTSVSLSDDGNTLAIGGCSDDSNIGATWIFTRSGTTWTQQGPKLVSNDYIGSSRQGQSVSLSADGNTLAIGSPDDNSSIGATWIFTRSSGTWTQQGSKLVGTNYIGSSKQGQSVSLSADGNTLVVGSPDDNNLLGAMWVFTRSGSTWTQYGPKLFSNDSTNILSVLQGFSVSIDDNGILFISGGPNNNEQTGATWVFNKN